MINAYSHSMGRALGAMAVLSLILLAVLLLATPNYHLAFIVPLGLFALLTISIAPQFAYYLIVFLIPYGAYRRVALPGAELNIPWIIAFLLIAILLVHDNQRRKLIDDLRSPYWALFAIFALIAIVSTVFSSYREQATQHIFLLIAGYVFVALGFLLISFKGLTRTMPAVLVTSITLSASIGILGYFFKLPNFADILQGGSTRALGASIDPNNLSLMIIFVVPVIVCSLLVSKSRKMRVLLLLSLAINVLSIGITFSRSGFVVFNLCLILLLIEYRRFLRPRHLGAFFIALLLLLGFSFKLVPANYWQRQKTLLEDFDRDTPLKRRLSYIFVAYDAFKDRPVIGHGPGTFRELYADSAYAQDFVPGSFDKGRYRRFAHNTYLEVLIGTGLIGLVVFAAMLLLTLKNFSSAKRKFLSAGDIRSADLAGGYRISFLSLAVFLLFFSDLYHKYLLLSFALSHASLNAAGARLRSPE